jgi:hypothetical protein
MTTIREARISDAPGIARVRVDTWRTAYRGIVSDEHLNGLSCERAEASSRRWLASAESFWSDWSDTSDTSDITHPNPPGHACVP